MTLSGMMQHVTMRTIMYDCTPGYELPLNTSGPHEVFRPWGQYLGRGASGLSWWQPGGPGPPSPGAPLT